LTCWTLWVPLVPIGPPVRDGLPVLSLPDPGGLVTQGGQPSW
jgi:hypothetical protein